MTKEYKNTWGSIKKPERITGNADANILIGSDSSSIGQIENIGKMKYVLQKYFGHADTYSIYVTACEQEMGAHKKKKNGAGAGDSRAQSGTNTI